MANFGKHAGKIIKAAHFKLSGKATAEEKFDQGTENIYFVARAHVHNIAYPFDAKSGQVMEMRIECDQLVVAPDSLVTEIASHLESIEEAERLAEEEAAAAAGVEE